MSSVSQREKSVERIHISTRILMTSRVETCANCGANIKLNDPHKHISTIRQQVDSDTSFEESVLCGADCVSDFA